MQRTRLLRRILKACSLLVLLAGTVACIQSVEGAQTLLSYRSDQPSDELPYEGTQDYGSPRLPSPVTPEPFSTGRYQRRQTEKLPSEIIRGNLPSATSAESPQVDPRKLALASRTDPGSKAPSTKSESPFALPVGQLFSTAGAGLAIVVGLFLVCAWLWRGGKHNPNATLPQEAFQVLGRAPLVGRANAQLIRVGNKLVLVAVTAEGLQPLTEVTDPTEVDRLAGLCLGENATSSTAEFQKILRKLAQEPASGFLGAEAA